MRYSGLKISEGEIKGLSVYLVDFIGACHVINIVTSLTVVWTRGILHKTQYKPWIHTTPFIAMTPLFAARLNCWATFLALIAHILHASIAITDVDPAMVLSMPSADPSLNSTAWQVLAYTTPWNSLGYAHTLEAAQRGWPVDAAPCWLQLKPRTALADHDAALLPVSSQFMLAGLHDIGPEWVAKLAEARCLAAPAEVAASQRGLPAPPSCTPAVLPRVIWEGGVALSAVPASELLQLGKTLATWAAQQRFGGLVLETGSLTQGEPLLAAVCPQLHALHMRCHGVARPDRWVHGARRFAEDPSVVQQLVLGGVVDRVTLMTYDYAPTGPQAPLRWVKQALLGFGAPAHAQDRKALQQWASTATGTRIRKAVLLGIPLYGAGPEGPKAVLDILQAHGPAGVSELLRTDTVAKEQYLALPGTANQRMYMPTPRMLRARARVARAAGAAGVAVWEAGQAPAHYLAALWSSHAQPAADHAR